MMIINTLFSNIKYDYDNGNGNNNDNNVVFFFFLFPGIKILDSTAD